MVYTGQVTHLFIRVVKYTTMCVMMYIIYSYKALMGNYRRGYEV